MATGAIDLDCWTEFEELRQPMAGSFQSTECVHIFAESMSVGTEDERKVPTFLCLPGLPLVYSTLEVYTEKAWTIIRKFGYEDVYNELGGPSGVFHRLENVMTLTSTLHVLFDKLKLWFEATVAPSRFFPPTLTNGPLPGYSKFVQSVFKFTRLLCGVRRSRAGGFRD